MKTRLHKLVWWIPVANAIVVGIALYLANHMNLGAALRDELLIGVFIAGYWLLVIRLPIDNHTAASPKPRAPFLGNRYPASARAFTAQGGASS